MASNRKQKPFILHLEDKYLIQALSKVLAVTKLVSGSPPPERSVCLFNFGAFDNSNNYSSLSDLIKWPQEQQVGNKYLHLRALLE